MTQPIQLEFDLLSTTSVQFGVGYDADDSHAFSLVAIDPSVESELRRMIDNTLNAQRDLTATPTEYDPANEYHKDDYFLVRLDNPLAAMFKDVHDADNLVVESATLDSPEKHILLFR